MGVESLGVKDLESGVYSSVWCRKWCVLYCVFGYMYMHICAYVVQKAICILLYVWPLFYCIHMYMCICVVESDTYSIACCRKCCVLYCMFSCMYIHICAYVVQKAIYFQLHSLYSIAYMYMCACVLLKVIRILLHGAESDVHCCIVCSLACIYIYVHMWWRKWCVFYRIFCCMYIHICAYVVEKVMCILLHSLYSTA